MRTNMAYREEVDEKLRNLAKPPGSLGLLEKQARQIFLAWGEMYRELKPKHIIFAADNGIVRSGAAAQLSEITYLQTKNMVDGLAAVSCFCDYNGIPYEVVDVGIDSEDAVGLDYKIRRRTRDFAVEPAMTADEVRRAMDIGGERVSLAVKEGFNLLSFGEMGIGNTTTSAAVLTALAPAHAALIAGYGSSRGNYKLLRHKEALITKALKKYGSVMKTPVDVLQHVGGFDLAAICGAMLACADRHIPFYADGFITAAALVCAVRINDGVRQYALLSHMSREAGMAVALRLIGMDESQILIHGEFSLGEGTGAVLAVSLMQSMMYAIWHMGPLDGVNEEAERKNRRKIPKKIKRKRMNERFAEWDAF